MTRDEMKKILMIIQSSYPNYNPDSMTFTIDLWHTMFKDYSFSVVSAALRNEIATNTTGFAPSIGKLLAEINKLKTNEKPILNANEAWLKVKFALRDSYYNSTEAFNELPKEIQLALVDASTLKNWSMIDATYVDTHIRYEFIKNYQNVISEQKERDITSLNQKTVNQSSRLNTKDGDIHEQKDTLQLQ